MRLHMLNNVNRVIQTLEENNVSLIELIFNNAYTLKKFSQKLNCLLRILQN